MKVKRSTQFEKTMSLGVNVIRVINDIQPFSDDELSQVGVMQNMHGGRVIAENVEQFSQTRPPRRSGVAA